MVYGVEWTRWAERAECVGGGLSCGRQLSLANSTIPNILVGKIGY